MSMRTNLARAELLCPLNHSRLRLPNRVVLAPMTRFRADIHGVPTRVMADYYAQRAGAGLLITEGIWPSERGQSDRYMPGLATDAQVAGWQRVTAAVHRRGGRIIAQLMHSGRASHPANRLDGQVPLAPSPVASTNTAHTPFGKAPFPVPRTMTTADISDAVHDHVSAARNAIRAGFDGVELHGANGYLIHQFLSDNTNLRSDQYGGDIGRRLTFPLEVTAAVADAIGADRVGVRLSPANPINGHLEAEPAAIYRPLVTALDELGLLYLHLIENPAYRALIDLRPRWSGVLIGNVGNEDGTATTIEAAAALVGGGTADLVSIGRLFIANPDLVDRIRAGADVDDYDRTTLYTHHAAGYSTYLPWMSEPALTCSAQ